MVPNVSPNFRYAWIFWFSIILPASFPHQYNIATIPQAPGPDNIPPWMVNKYAHQFCARYGYFQ